MTSLKSRAPLPPKVMDISDSGPYGLLWLDSFFQEVALPNGEWQKVALKINACLADHIRKQFGQEQRKQMIFELMGPDYVQTYFPEEEYRPTLVEEPHVSKEERKKLQVDAQNWLQKELTKVTAEMHCERPTPGYTAQSAPSQEMVEFLGQVRFLATKNLDIHLHLQEREILKAWEEYHWKQDEAKEKESEKLERIKLKREYERLRGREEILPRSILRGSSTPSLYKPPPSAASIFTTVSEADQKPTANIKGAIHGAVEDPPTFWGMQSNSIGRSVVAILKRDPRRYGQVAAKLHGRQLPGTLRTYLWLDMLLRAERERLKDINAERLVRERFGKALSRGITDLKVKRASHSPISGLIDNAVIEIYDRSPGMRCYLDQNQHMKEAAKALNILYVYDRTYEPYLIYWLFPLQVAFHDFSGQSEHIYDLAMYLDLLNKSCFPTWPQIFAVAEQVMTRLKEADTELHDHLEKISLINVNINPKEFLVQMIHLEKKKAQSLISGSPTKAKSSPMSKALLADPRIFLRKWVGEGFGSVLDTQAVVYVWDQCFMQRWETRVLEDFCLALLLLLRNEFMDATDYREMKQVFLREPCKLYTMDIQHAWYHIQINADYTKVPGINRRTHHSARPTTIEPIAPRPYTPSTVVQESPAPSVASLELLPPVGMKHLRLKLVLPAQGDSDLSDSDIRVICSVYYGTVRLTTETSSVPGQQSAIRTDAYGKRQMSVSFPTQRFVYRTLDTSQYDLEREMGAYPYAILQVVSKQSTQDSVTLGWTRIKLFQAASEARPSSDHDPWLLEGGDIWHTINIGEVPEPGTRSTSQVSYHREAKGWIGNNSQLGALVFHPDKEPPTPGNTSTYPSKNPTPVSNRTPTAAGGSNSPDIPGISDTFMLYVDGVDNIPDNATITKVTGRVVKTGALKGLEDVLAVPELSSRARCPRYSYQLPVNEPQVETDPDMLLLLRVYTVDRISSHLEVIGSCLCQVFDLETQKLRVGGHQRVLHYGMPDLSKGLGALDHTSLDTAPRVPGCTLFYRLLPPGQEASQPVLNDENYPLDDAGFNKSEQKVIASYNQDAKHPKNTEDMVRRLRSVEDATDNEESLDAWILNRLDHKVQLLPNQSAAFLSLARMVHYRPREGLRVEVSGAAGLPGGLYTACCCRVYPGGDNEDQQTTPIGNPKSSETFFSVKTDLDSHQVAPQWLENVKTIHPQWDIHSVLVIQVFGVSIKYTATAEHEEAGSLTDPSGAELKLQAEHNLGWTVLPLFEELYTNQGEHHLPLFVGKPDPELIKSFSQRSVEDILKSLENSQKLLERGSLTVRMWDGHFSATELLEPLKHDETLLEVVGDKNDYITARAEAGGDRLSQFVLDGLSAADRERGADGPVYSTEKQHFTELVNKTLLQLMEYSLL